MGSVVGLEVRILKQPYISSAYSRGLGLWRVAGPILDFILVALVEPPISPGFSSLSPITKEISGAY